MNQEMVDNPFQPRGPAEPDNASAHALAQREVAEVQAGMVIAKKFPRNQKEAMDRILTACTRPNLADQAVYQYARGGQDITGPSIRLAEELARGWGNIRTGVTELSRGNGVSECLAYCLDLESNYGDEKRFHVKHWRDTRQGGYALKDERDIYELIANQGARRKRACILAIIPGDVVEAALDQCDLTLKTKIEITPERVNAMVEKFAAYGVTKEHIEARIQRRLDAITPALFVNLGKIYNSLKDGMSAPADWFDMPEKKSANGNGSTTLADLKKQKVAEQPEPERKPVEPEQTEALTAGVVAKMIDAAETPDQLDVAMDLIRELPQNERDEVKRKAVRKYQEIMG